MIEKYVRPCVLNCRDYVPGKPVEEVQRELGLTDVYKMASNENPLGPSPLAQKAAASILRISLVFIFFSHPSRNLNSTYGSVFLRLTVKSRPIAIFQPEPGENVHHPISVFFILKTVLQL